MNATWLRWGVVLAALTLTGAARADEPNRLAGLLTLRDYNTRVVLTGVSLLGAASGLIGTFMLLRKRALLGDALSHATLPGVGIAFLLNVAAGGEGKSLPWLLAGAAATGALGMLSIVMLTRWTRTREDAALGIVLSVFFGLGIVITTYIQGTRSGHAAGLSSFIYGKTASMLLSDAWLIAAAAGVTLVACVALFKEFTLLCFDAAYARSQGWPALWIDLLLMAGVLGVTVIGLQAVGLILMVALLVIPPAAARFWTDRLGLLLILASLLGAVSGFVGAAISALRPDLPAGAVIVLAAGALFLFSMLAGPARGVVARWVVASRARRATGRQHVLRALYEATEVDPRGDSDAAPLSRLLAARSWSPVRLRRLLRSASGDGLCELLADDRVRLTGAGREAARRAVRNHRLWELFLMNYADKASSHVDQIADEIEHVLDPGILRSLEESLAREAPPALVPASPHRLNVER